jgi:lysophospholipase L1-like esterase
MAGFRAGRPGPRAVPRKWRRASAALALMVVSAAVALCCAELLVRRLPLLDPGMGVRGLAGRAQFIDSPQGYSFYVNTLGFRTQDFTPAKQAGLVRVVMIGDSHAYGVGVDDEDRVSERLRLALQGSLRRKVEVLNVAQPGTTWTDYLAAARAAAAWRPDLLIVLTYTGNDVGELAMPTLKKTAGQARRRGGWLLGNLRRFHLWHLIRRGFARRPAQVFELGKPPCQATLNAEDVGAFAQAALEACVMSRLARPEDLELRTRQLSAELSRVARSQRSPLIIAALPPRVLVEPASPHGNFDTAATTLGLRTAEARALLARAHAASCRPVEGAIVVDLLGPLRDSHAGSLYFERDWHLNREGHRVAAAVLAQDILRRQLIGKP